MDPRSALPQHISDALAQGATVITANQRAARTLQRDYSLLQKARGLTFWEPPPVLAWDTWLNTLWRQLLLQGLNNELLLSRSQEHTLWRQLIQNDPALAGLHPIDDLARTAAEAWLLVHQYRAAPRLRAFPGNSDTRTFVRWAATFRSRCKRSGYLTSAELPEALGSAVIAGQLPLPHSLLLVGFDSKTPAQLAFLDHVRSAGSGTSILEPAAPGPATSPSLIDAPDEYTETAACARWLHDQLTERPDARLAVIVPAIDTCRARIDRQFRSVLAPELNHISARTDAAPYEFSLGIPLSHTALISTALDILRWAVGPLPMERVSALLLSPFFATPADASTETLARAEFDAFVLRQQHLLQPSITADRVLRLLSRSQFAADLPGLLRHLSEFSQRAQQINPADTRRTHSAWADAFNNLLTAAGFAPAPRLDSVQFQARGKWEEALDELAALDFNAERSTVHFKDAQAELQRIAEDTLFAPESLNAPVQIMGPLESAGSSFDAVWFLHANDLAWPSPPSTNSLLPWQMQREYGMPGTDHTRDAEHARRITHRIAGCAPVAVFSYARESAEGLQRPSSCLTSLPPLALRSAATLAALPPHRPIALEPVFDSAAVPPPPGRVLRGGAAILQAQAACGFRAFAERRLFATSPGSVSLGLDARERGSLLHAVLEDFWREVRTQAALRQMTAAERDAQLHRSIDAALERHHARPADGWPRAYVTAERRRLAVLLTQFLDYEASVRRPFTVLAPEQTLPAVSIGPLHLDVRVDRIDAVVLARHDGTDQQGEVIIDYKTGKATPSEWLGDRPDAPQLPLYAVVSNSPHLAAVAFATVRPGKEMGLRGYQAEDGILPGSSRLSSASLDTQIAEWRRVLESLADNFYQGRAEVAPKSYPKTCTYCEQRLFCRLDPTTLETDDDESELAAEEDLV